MFVAILLVCSLDYKTCEVKSHPELIEDEELCYYTLGLGMNYYEDQGYAVPVYRCLQLLEKEDMKS